MAGRDIRIIATVLVCLPVTIAGPASKAMPVVGATDMLRAPDPNSAPTDPVAQSLQAWFQNGAQTALSPELSLAGKEFAAMKAFYAARQWRPVWTRGGLISKSGLSVISRLRQSATDGLDPAAYGTPSSQLGRFWPVPAVEIARSELLIARSVMRYARHAGIGRVRPRDVSRHIALVPRAENPIAVLTTVSEAADPGETLAGYNPRHPEFLALRAQLAAFVKGTKQPVEMPAEMMPVRKMPIPAGPTIEPGQQHPRVALLRNLLHSVPVNTDPRYYDEDLRAAVVEFQSANGLKPDGLVGRQTRAALNKRVLSIEEADRPDNVPPASLGGIVANMEFWRWMPDDLGNVHVIVNVPEYRMRVVSAGEMIHTTKVIVGKVKHQTPIFSDEMEHVVVNPYWNVPRSIARNEMLSSIRANPTGYLQSRGYEVLYGGRRIHPASIYWDTETVKRVSIRQRPGARNALGRIKFLFPNKHSVYLHDTPSRRLFDKSARAFSHGCIRVHHPLKFADALLSADKTVSGRQIRGLLGRKERWVNLDRHIPVHISYFTTWVDASGRLRTAHDIYGHEKKVREMLRL